MENMTEHLAQERSQKWREALRKSMKAKDRTSLERVAMPEADPAERAKSHGEVNQGLSEQMAVDESRRCLDCPDTTCVQ